RNGLPALIDNSLCRYIYLDSDLLVYLCPNGVVRDLRTIRLLSNASSAAGAVVLPRPAMGRAPLAVVTRAQPPPASDLESGNATAGRSSTDRPAMSADRAGPATPAPPPRSPRTRSPESAVARPLRRSAGSSSRRSGAGRRSWRTRW